VGGALLFLKQNYYVRVVKSVLDLT